MMEEVMGMLVDGEWRMPLRNVFDGHFERRPTTFRNWVTADGSPGPTGSGDFVAEKKPVSSVCQLGLSLAHRTLIMRRLKGLRTSFHCPLSLAHARTRWTSRRVLRDRYPVNEAQALYEVYLATDPHYTDG